MAADDGFLAGFEAPSSEHGPIPLWWWDGDVLEPERMTEQLETLAEGGIRGVCFISKYPHGPRGDEVGYFSELWWERLEHAVAECDRLGLSLWVHDETYHHSPPTWREYWQDAIRTEAGGDPELRGRVLHREACDVSGGDSATLTLEEEFEPLSVAAYPRRSDGRLSLEDAQPIAVEDGRCEWTAPAGEWHVAAIGTRPEGLRYTDSHAVERYIDLHFEEYVRRLGDRVGDVLVGTFEDELVILDGSIPCDDRLLERFEAEQGYDPVPRLVALYEETAATVSTRVDYYDVLTTMLEEHWFEPLFEWHADHGLERAHDNWGRNDLAAGTEQYGDYYRTMRWYQTPGYDDGGPAPIGSRNFFDAKLSASIAACYDRDRVWGELFHSTGWGFSPEEQLAGLVENVCYGCSLYDAHGLYYTTLGGWWEHAPGDVHFRQPYWDHADALNDAAARLGHLFSRGHPVVDAAIAVPSAALHADWHPETGVGAAGNRADAATREIAEVVYRDGTDLILADEATLAESAAADGGLHINDMTIPALVVPPAAAIDRGTLGAARRLHEAGGLVLFVGSVPERAVGGEATVAGTLDQLFGEEPVPTAGEAIDAVLVDREGAGIAALAPIEEAPEVLEETLETDVGAAPNVYHTHRRIDGTDLYLLFNARDAARTIDCRLRAEGPVSHLDLETGAVEPGAPERVWDGSVSLTLSFAPHGYHVIAVGAEAEHPDRSATGSSNGQGNSPRSIGSAGVVDATKETGDATRIDLDGWSFEPLPTLDNRWGDFRYPRDASTIGVEIGQFEYRLEGADEDGIESDWIDGGDDPEWTAGRPGVGPYFWRRTGEDDPDVAAPAAAPDDWEPYELSLETGRDGTHPYLLGYAGICSDEFLVSPSGGSGLTQFWTTVRAPDAGQVAIQYGSGIEWLELGDRRITVGEGSGVAGMKRESSTLAEGRATGWLPAGSTPLRVGVRPGTATHVAIEPIGSDARDRDMAATPRLRWFRDSPYTFDARPWLDAPVGWYRVRVPVGATALSVPIPGAGRFWLDGTELPVEDGRVHLPEPRSRAVPGMLRVEHAGSRYGGAALDGPIAVETAPVPVELDPWESLGLVSFSGRGQYRTTASLPALEPDARVVLDLGEVAVSAEVTVNGTPVGTTFARPHRFDITEAVRPGENDLVVTVANTLANHFQWETPRRYVDDAIGYRGEDGAVLPNAARDRPRSGLLGPTRIRIESD